MFVHIERMISRLSPIAPKTDQVFVCDAVFRIAFELGSADHAAVVVIEFWQEFQDLFGQLVYAVHVFLSVYGYRIGEGGGTVKITVGVGLLADYFGH